MAPLSQLPRAVPLVRASLEARPRDTVDWLFRSLGEAYRPGQWDPHYITGLYLALQLYLREDFPDPAASSMAL